jgi:hypothetical protein
MFITENSILEKPLDGPSQEAPQDGIIVSVTSAPSKLPAMSVPTGHGMVDDGAIQHTNPPSAGGLAGPRQDPAPPTPGRIVVVDVRDEDHSGEPQDVMGQVASGLAT